MDFLQSHHGCLFLFRTPSFFYKKGRVNRGENLLKKSKILQGVHRLAQRRKEKVYLVGGAVRDFLLPKALGKDFDFVTTKNARDLCQEVAAETKGHVFPLDESLGEAGRP